MKTPTTALTVFAPSPILKIVGEYKAADLLYDATQLFPRHPLWIVSTKDAKDWDSDSQSIVCRLTRYLLIFVRQKRGFVSLDSITDIMFPLQSELETEDNRIRIRAILKRCVDLLNYVGHPCVLCHNYTKQGYPMTGISFHPDDRNRMKDTLRSARVERTNVLALVANAGK